MDSVLKKALNTFKQYKNDVEEGKKTPFFNKNNTPRQWLGRVAQDTKKRGWGEGVQGLANPMLKNRFIEPVAEPIISKARVANYKAGRPSGFINALLGQRDSQVAPRQKPFGVANTVTGHDLMSNNALRETPRSRDIRARAQALKDNVLSQRQFTPEARRYLEQVQVNARPLWDGADGMATSYGPRPNQRRIDIDPRILYGNASRGAANTMTHEMIHVLDRKMGPQENVMNDPRTFNSYGFYPSLESVDPAHAEYIRDHLSKKDKLYRVDPRTLDVEGAAYFAGSDGEDVLMGPMSDYYQDTFVPQSKQYNSTPMYPTKQYWEQIRGLVRGESVKAGKNVSPGQRIPLGPGKRPPMKGKRIPIKRKLKPKTPKRGK